MTEAIVVRPYEPGDAQGLFEAAKESWQVVGPWLPWCHEGYTLDDARAWAADCAAAVRAGTRYELAVVRGERFVGGCGLNELARERREGNLGYWVRASERGHGVAPEAVRLLVAWARAHTTLERIVIRVPAGNAASLRVAEKVGAVREGVVPRLLRLHGKRHDAVVFSIALAAAGR